MGAQQNQGIRFTFAADGGNILAFLGRFQSGLSQVNRATGQSAQGMSFFSKQLRAVGTTMRYAFAGEVVFRIRQAIQNLSQFQKGVADIAAIGQNPNGLPLTQRQLDGLATSALKLSAATATPATDITETIRSIYSSLQNVTPQQVERLTGLATKGAQISETDPRSFIQSIIGMKNAFGDETGNMTQIADQFFTVIQRSINMSGDEWAKFSGRVVAAAKVANISLTDMNALMIQMTRAGGTAAVNVRHLSQLFMRIRFPTRGAQGAYREAGLTPEMLTTMSGPEIMRALLAHAEALSGRTVQQFSAQELKRMGPVRANAALQGASRQALQGPGLAFLQKAVGGRMEAFRAFNVLAPQVGELQTEVEALRHSGGAVDRAFNRFIKQDPLQAMAVAMSSLSTGITSNMNPLFRQMARATMWFANVANAGRLPHIPSIPQPHNRMGKIVEDIGIATVGAVALRQGLKMLGRGGGAKAGLGNLAKGGGILSSSFLSAEVLPAAVAGTANGTRPAPFWVIIHPLSWTLGGPGGGFGGGGRGKGGTPGDFYMNPGGKNRGPGNWRPGTSIPNQDLRTAEQEAARSGLFRRILDSTAGKIVTNVAEYAGGSFALKKAGNLARAAKTGWRSTKFRPALRGTAKGIHPDVLEELLGSAESDAFGIVENSFWRRMALGVGKFGPKVARSSVGKAGFVLAVATAADQFVQGLTGFAPLDYTFGKFGEELNALNKKAGRQIHHPSQLFQFPGSKTFYSGVGGLTKQVVADAKSGFNFDKRLAVDTGGLLSKIGGKTGHILVHDVAPVFTPMLSKTGGQKVRQLYNSLAGGGKNTTIWSQALSQRIGDAGRSGQVVALDPRTTLSGAFDINLILTPTGALRAQVQDQRKKVHVKPTLAPVTTGPRTSRGQNKNNRR